MNLSNGNIRASDEESYSYRIGMIHKRREVAYANTGVRSGAFSTDLSVVNFTRVAFDLWEGFCLERTFGLRCWDCFSATPLYAWFTNFSCGRTEVMVRAKSCNLVDPASSHMLVSKIKPCMSKYKLLYGETANGSLKQLSSPWQSSSFGYLW